MRPLDNLKEGRIQEKVNQFPRVVNKKRFRSCRLGGTGFPKILQYLDFLKATNFDKPPTVHLASQDLNNSRMQSVTVRVTVDLYIAYGNIQLNPYCPSLIDVKNSTNIKISLYNYPTSGLGIRFFAIRSCCSFKKSNKSELVLSLFFKERRERIALVVLK